MTVVTPSKVYRNNHEVAQNVIDRFMEAGDGRMLEHWVTLDGGERADAREYALPEGTAGREYMKDYPEEALDDIIRFAWAGTDEGQQEEKAATEASRAKAKARNTAEYLMPCDGEDCGQQVDPKKAFVLIDGSGSKVFCLPCAGK